jgi:integrase
MPLTIYRRGNIWHYRGTVNRHRLRGSTRTTDKERAQRITAELEAREWKRHLDGPAAVLRFSDAAALYVNARKPTRFLRPLLIYWRETPVSQITAGAIRQAALTIYPDASAATRNRAVITVTAAVINHAAESELCHRIRVRRFPVERKEKRPVSWTWVTAFMSSASINLGALACYMFLTGARISEALALTWDDVHFQKSTASIRQTKTGTYRTAHLQAPLIIALANIPGPHEGRVFGYSSRQSCDRSWRRACVRAGIEVLSFHSCRHGFATELLRNGVDVKTVARLGGWASAMQVLTTYAHALDDLTLTDRLVGANETQPRRTMPKVIGE